MSEVAEESQPNAKESANAFADENILTALLIQMTRVYEVQMALLFQENRTAAQRLETKHREGRYTSPPPAIAYRDNASPTGDHTE